MRRLGLVLIAACALAACGGDDRGSAPTKADTTPAVNQDVAQLRTLCARVTRAEAQRPAADPLAVYASFLRGLRKLDAPEQIAAQERAHPTTAAEVHEAYASDDAADARVGAIDCIWPSGAQAADAFPLVDPAKLAELAPALNGICSDNRARTARAHSLAGDAPDVIEEGSADRLARLIAAAPRPTDAGPAFGGWTDALRTVANLYRLAAGTNDQDRAKALREQAARTAAAARKSAAKLGLTGCAQR